MWFTKHSNTYDMWIGDLLAQYTKGSIYSFHDDIINLLSNFLLEEDNLNVETSVFKTLQDIDARVLGFSTDTSIELDLKRNKILYTITDICVRDFDFFVVLEIIEHLYDITILPPKDGILFKCIIHLDRPKEEVYFP